MAVGKDPGQISPQNPMRGHCDGGGGGGPPAFDELDDALLTDEALELELPAEEDPTKPGGAAGAVGATAGAAGATAGAAGAGPEFP